MKQVGVISDTHGQLYPAAMEALHGSDLILHAGDVGRLEVLQGLQEIAPVWAVRGNMDWGGWAQSLPQSQVVEVEQVLLYVLHDALKLDLDPAAAGLAAVISGHTHRPHLEQTDGVWYVNPGSAGRARIGLEPSVARMIVDGEGIQAEILHLQV